MEKRSGDARHDDHARGPEAQNSQSGGALRARFGRPRTTDLKSTGSLTRPAASETPAPPGTAGASPVNPKPHSGLCCGRSPTQQKQFRRSTLPNGLRLSCGRPCATRVSTGGRRRVNHQPGGRRPRAPHGNQSRRPSAAAACWAAMGTGARSRDLNPRGPNPHDHIRQTTDGPE